MGINGKEENCREAKLAVRTRWWWRFFIYSP